MDNIFISNIQINKVRHLTEINIPLSAEKKKHLIITGKNGSGKTSLLNAMAIFLNLITYSEFPYNLITEFETEKNNLKYCIDNQGSEKEIIEIKKRIKKYRNLMAESMGGLMLEINQQLMYISELFEQGKYIVAYYQADRVFKAEIPEHIEKVKFKNGYGINESPRNEFVKYLLDLKMTEALAVSNGKHEKAGKIKQWFDAFQELLKEILEDDSVRLIFDEDTFKFTIVMNGREPFDFNTLSSGYAAIMDIVVDLIIRMERQSNKVFDFSIPGIVLIDEIETHLHLELQKKILRMLTTLFPNIQFIVSTHSPFILNSLENVVIYDLENKTLVKNGLADVPYGGIVEGYFKANEMSEILKNKYDRYKHMVDKQVLTEEDLDEIADLEMYLDEIPDYLALNITTEYQRLKQELRKREEV